MSIWKSVICSALCVALFLPAVATAKAPEPEEYVVTLYHRFAYRDPQPAEVTYWTERILTMTPEAAEKRLRNWFFVHAAYKTSLDRTVTISEVEHLVDLLDKDQLTYQSIQWSIFSSEEYKQAKADGRAGKMMKYEAPRP